MEPLARAAHIDADHDGLPARYMPFSALRAWLQHWSYLHAPLPHRDAIAVSMTSFRWIEIMLITPCPASSCTSTSTPSTPPSSNATTRRGVAFRWWSAPSPAGAAWWPPAPTRPAATACTRPCRSPRRRAACRRRPSMSARAWPITRTSRGRSWVCWRPSPRSSSRSPSTRRIWMSPGWRASWGRPRSSPGAPRRRSARPSG